MVHHGAPWFFCNKLYLGVKTQNPTSYMHRLSLNLFPELKKTSLNSYAFPISLVAIWHFPTSAIVTISLSLSLFVFFNHFQQHIHLLSNPSASLIRFYLKHHRRSFMLKRAFLMLIFIYYFPNPIR